VIPTPAPPGRLAPFLVTAPNAIIPWPPKREYTVLAGLPPEYYDRPDSSSPTRLASLPRYFVPPQRFPQQAHPKTRPTIWMVYPYSITRGIIKYFTNARTPRRRGQPRVVDSLHQDADAGATASQTCGVLKKKSYIAVS
jgi:hypothetical protein